MQQDGAPSETLDALCLLPVPSRACLGPPPRLLGEVGTGVRLEGGLARAQPAAPPPHAAPRALPRPPCLPLPPPPARRLRRSTRRRAPLARASPAPAGAAAPSRWCRRRRWRRSSTRWARGPLAGRGCSRGGGRQAGSRAHACELPAPPPACRRPSCLRALGPASPVDKHAEAALSDSATRSARPARRHRCRSRRATSGGSLRLGASGRRTCQSASLPASPPAAVPC